MAGLTTFTLYFGMHYYGSGTTLSRFCPVKSFGRDSIALALALGDGRYSVFSVECRVSSVER